MCLNRDNHETKSSDTTVTILKIDNLAILKRISIYDTTSTVK